MAAWATAAGRAANATSAALAGTNTYLNQTGLLSANESVLPSEAALWKFIGVRRGLLCPLVGFEESPYYLLALQVLTSFAVVTATYMCSSGQAPAVGSEQLPQIVLVEEGERGVSFSVRDEDRDDDETIASAIQRLGLRADGPVEVVYWALQTVMFLKQLLTIAVAAWGSAHVQSWWQRYNLFVYSFAFSGAFATGVQALTSNVWPCFAQMLIGQVTCFGYQGRGRISVLARHVKLPSNGGARCAALFLLVAAAPVVTHVFPFFLLHCWCSIPVFCLILTPLTCRCCSSMERTNAADSDFFKVLTQWWPWVENGYNFITLLMLTLTLQTSISVMTRVYAGEMSLDGYAGPLANDFMARTLATSLACLWLTNSKSADSFMDFALRWT